jgi:hypothetical protein
MTSYTYFVGGCGHFGNLAVRKLLKRKSTAGIIAVDKDKDALRAFSDLPIEAVAGDAVSSLDGFLSEGHPIDYVIPAVPFHFAFEYVLCKLKPLGRRRGEVPILPDLPNLIRGERGDVYTSIAHFVCPEDCPEPAQSCPATGKRRQNPLYRVLMDLPGPFESIVIRSHQLGLGVGGFRPRVLVQLVEKIKMQEWSHPLILISTACRCHGVISALS